MNVTNCRGCGRLFNVTYNNRLCPQCVQGLEEKFQQIKKYLDQNPNASVDAVAQDNEVSVKQIKQWVREERLIFAEGSTVGIDCEMCGVQIRTGKYCDSCKFKISNNLMSALDRPPIMEPRREVKEHDRMRFLKN